MSELYEVLSRASSHLENFRKNKHLNDARQFAEAISKILYLNAETETLKNIATQAFNTRIENLKKLTIEENAIKKIKYDLETIQTYGNTNSHDNSLSHVDMEHNFKKVTDSLSNLIKYVFAPDLIFIDEKIPENILEFIDEKINLNENWRCEKIVDTVYPRRQKKSNNGLFKGYGYEFIIVDDKAANLKIGFLFLAKNIKIESVINSFITSNSGEIYDLANLTVLFPKEISKLTGKPVIRRKENIEKNLKDKIKTRTSYFFIEDYIWTNCLPEQFKENGIHEAEEYFIDQEIYSEQIQKSGLQYIRENFLESNNKNPVTAFIGEGGVGKTTFCNEICRLINSSQDVNKKISLLISSFDIHDSEELGNLSSIQSLYKLTGMDDIDTDIFELNISCGNIIIVIDGLDEIESRLKEKFSLNEFINSIIELNDTYNNCSVIITSRNGNFDNIEKRNEITVFEMKGFNEEQIDNYLKNRFKKNHELIGKIKTESQKIVNDNIDAYLTPLLLHLVCNFFEDEQDISSYISDDSKYFLDRQPLDSVLKATIKREIDKQIIPLGIDVNCDDYFEILNEIAINGGSSSISHVAEMINALVEENDEQLSTFVEKIKLSPLLKFFNLTFSFKYDYLVSWTLSRFALSSINKNTVVSENFMKIAARHMYRGDYLTKDINGYRSDENLFEYERKIIKKAIESMTNDESKDIFYRKVISAMLYLISASEQTSRENHTKKILSIYPNENKTVKYFSIFGDFIAIDFSEVTIDSGYFKGYDNLWKCKFPEYERIVFKKTKFVETGDKYFSKERISPLYFSECDLDSLLKEKINIIDQSKNKKFDKIKADIKSILRVGYKSNMFSYKSDLVYKKDCGTLKSGLSLTEYLSLLQEKGFLKVEDGKTGGHGYNTPKDKQNIIKEFITQSNPRKEILELIDFISGKV